ncbi:di-heme oxidoredictase family protein [Nevskia ramosa]|uniref:di-heme oxidoredictase family protein n=1 Tax=Nevskia ramosa TaxID=64002 RepID=UPI0003B62E65|nr:di-heme oxidoredictase family protein [Nevskia ramosa]
MRRLSGCLALLLALAAVPASAAQVLRPFDDPRDPPTWRPLTDAEQALHELGLTVFNTSWRPAGAARAERIDGLGPVFNAASCDACHNNGARARTAVEPGLIPVSMVVQLSGPDGKAADPSYGHVLNTAAIDGFQPEAQIRLSHVERPGRYPDGRPWSLRVPTYRFDELRLGPLRSDTVIKPRLAPALFGSGLLDAVPAAADDGAAGRFGWQGNVSSLAAQTGQAFAQDMGLTSADLAQDDCGAADALCRAAESGGEPEVSNELLAAVMAYQRLLAVPASPPLERPLEKAGLALFERHGCASCHRSNLPVSGIEGLSSIAPYTDLRRHDLGPGLADRSVSGEIQRSRWRTAPLWGLGYAVRRPPYALLHDGRARSIEEAVLWHDGEAASARRRFERSSAKERQSLLDWLSAR